MNATSPSVQLRALSHVDGRRDEEISVASTMSFATAPSPSRKKQALVLVSTFLMIFQTIGINQTYGIFQEFYTTSPDSFLPAQQANNQAAVAFVGTLGAGLTWGGSIFVNPLVGRTKNVRWITGLGSVGMSLGLVLAGQSKNVREAISAFKRTVSWSLDVVLRGLVFWDANRFFLSFGIFILHNRFFTVLVHQCSISQ